jgi:hypothetical protein
MPRQRKYDYDNFPETLFIKIPKELKQELERNFSDADIQRIVANFLSNLIKNNKK